MDVESSTSEILSNKNQAIVRGEYYHHIGGVLPPHRGQISENDVKIQKN